MSPRGLATRPRIPAIWRTCIMFPRAPEPTIMSIGLNCCWRNETSMASRTSSVAAVQISTSFWRRSPSVMMPRRNWVSIFSASSSCMSRMAFFSAGVRTSSIDTVSPEREANLNASALIRSRLAPTSALG